MLTTVIILKLFATSKEFCERKRILFYIPHSYKVMEMCSISKGLMMGWEHLIEVGTIHGC